MKFEIGHYYSHPRFGAVHIISKGFSVYEHKDVVLAEVANHSISGVTRPSIELIPDTDMDHWYEMTFAEFHSAINDHGIDGYPVELKPNAAGAECSL